MITSFRRPSFNFHHKLVFFAFRILNRKKYLQHYISIGDRGSTVVKVLGYKSEGSWFDPSRCQWIFH